MKMPISAWNEVSGTALRGKEESVDRRKGLPQPSIYLNEGNFNTNKLSTEIIDIPEEDEGSDGSLALNVSQGVLPLLPLLQAGHTQEQDGAAQKHTKPDGRSRPVNDEPEQTTGREDSSERDP